MQKIIKSCDYYVNKCQGKDSELGGACRMVRELAKEVKEQADIIEKKSSEASGEHYRMSTLLEEYLTVFTDDSSLKLELAETLGYDWVQEHGGHAVLTPATLHHGLIECMSQIHDLRRQLQNSQASLSFLVSLFVSLFRSPSLPPSLAFCLFRSLLLSLSLYTLLCVHP